MSDPSFGTPGDGERNDAGRVRTYRGRTIEELIPRIREELGPDAIILREREGLTGGIGGFFAQRCVEIDAQAAPRLSVYDDDFDEEDAEYEEAAVADEGPAAPHWSAPAERAPEPLPLQREPSPPLAPEPPTVPPRPAGAFLNEASFAARLEEATLAAGPAAPAPDEPEPEPAPEPESEAPRRGTPAFIAFDELGDDDEPEEEAPAPAPPDSDDASPPTLSHRLLDLAEINYTGPAPAPPIRREPVVREPEPVAWEPEPEPEPEPSPEPEPEPQPEPEADPVDLAPDPTAPWMTFAAEQVTADPPARRASRPSATAESGAPPPFAPPQPPWNAAPRATPAEPVTPAAPEQAAPAPASNGPSPQPNPYGGQSPATPYQPWGPAAYGPRRRGGILPAAERVLRAALDATHAANERRSLELQARYTAPPHLPSPSATPEPSPSLAPEPASPPPPPEPDTDATRRQAEQARAARLQERLVESGVSPQRAAALVTTAVSRRGPFSADTELAQELRSAITSALPAPTPVPRRGAIAVVGAGGSGKTRSVAALATAYADAGIPVSVATFGGSAREDELGELLHGEDVNIMPAMRTRATGRAVASAREESLVIVDTASVTPGTGSAMDVIAEALRGFELDAIYLAVPATLSLPAGLKLMSGFSAFDLAGIIATHVDEADQLGVIAELAMRTSVPIAYTHTGLDLQNAIASADAGDIATSLV